MADDPAFSLDKYVVERDRILTVHLNLDFKDEKGNIMLQTKSKLMVTQQNLQTPDGHVLCAVTHKMLSLMPTYQIHDGGVDGPVSAIVKENFTINPMLNSINIEDGSGNIIAVANGNIFGFEFTVSTPDGTNVATITRKFSFANFKDMIDMAKNPYMITISNRSIPMNALFGFFIVIELLAAKSNQGGINMGGFGMGPGFGAPGGMVGGGFHGGGGGHR